MIKIVLVTAPKKTAKTLARVLLKEKVCACVNIISNAESFYWWQGKIDSSKEVLLVIKTRAALFQKLKLAVEKNHPYDVPEIIGWDASDSNKAYRDWVNASCAK